MAKTPTNLIKIVSYSGIGAILILIGALIAPSIWSLFMTIGGAILLLSAAAIAIMTALGVYQEKGLNVHVKMLSRAPDVEKDPVNRDLHYSALEFASGRDKGLP